MKAVNQETNEENIGWDDGDFSNNVFFYLKN